MEATDKSQPPDPGEPGAWAVGASLAEAVLIRTQYLYALILLVAFIVGAAWYSVFNAKKEEDLVQPTATGPGGKPLPITKHKKRDNGDRKLGPRFGAAAKNVFRYLAGALFLSYATTGGFMFVHAFYHENPQRWAREGLPWAGIWSVVRIDSRTGADVLLLL